MIMAENNYEKAYFYLFNAITDTITDMESIVDKLKYAQCGTEEIIMRDIEKLKEITKNSGGVA